MKASNYGELIAGVAKQELLAYKEYGSYQGDYLAITREGDFLNVWKGSYGSCSGCDWLEGEKDWDSDEVSSKKAAEYVASEKPFINIAIATASNLLSSGKFKELMPANTRNDYADWSEADLEKLILEAIKQPHTDTQ